MITNTNTSLTLLNVGMACHQADWNWHNVRSPFARIYYVVEGHAEILLSNKKLELTAGRLYLIPPFTTLMKKVKITILKTMLNEDLAKEYGICGLKACPMMKVGDVFYADYAKPVGFCDEAWKAIYQYVFALAHGADKERCPPRCYQHRGLLPSTMVTGSRNQG